MDDPSNITKWLSVTTLITDHKGQVPRDNMDSRTCTTSQFHLTQIHTMWQLVLHHTDSCHMTTSSTSHWLMHVTTNSKWHWLMPSDDGFYLTFYLWFEIVALEHISPMPVGGYYLKDIPGMPSSFCTHLCQRHHRCVQHYGYTFRSNKAYSVKIQQALEAKGMSWKFT